MKRNKIYIKAKKLKCLITKVEFINSCPASLSFGEG